MDSKKNNRPAEYKVKDEFVIKMKRYLDTLITDKEKKNNNGNSTHK